MAFAGISAWDKSAQANPFILVGSTWPLWLDIKRFKNCNIHIRYKLLLAIHWWRFVKYSTPVGSVVQAYARIFLFRHFRSAEGKPLPLPRILRWRESDETVRHGYRTQAEAGCQSLSEMQVHEIKGKQSRCSGLTSMAVNVFIVWRTTAGMQ